MSEDPARAGLNWYTYCNNNPVVFFDPYGLEQIVVSGGAYHYGESEYQYEFVDSALLQISMLDGDSTLLIAYAGWDDTQYDAIVQAAADRGINLVWFNNIDELTNYINYGGIDGTGNRANDPITSFYVFSHGTDSGTGNYAITFGLYTDKNSQLSWYTGDISSVNSSAFSSGVESVFYACRTGNNFNNGIFAQAWANTTGGLTYAYYGFNGRSRYSDINGNSYQTHYTANGNRWMVNQKYLNWYDARGDVRTKPSEAYSLPHASYLTEWGIYYPT